MGGGGRGGGAKVSEFLFTKNPNLMKKKIFLGGGGRFGMGGMGMQVCLVYIERVYISLRRDGYVLIIVAVIMF